MQAAGDRWQIAAESGTDGKRHLARRYVGRRARAGSRRERLEGWTPGNTARCGGRRQTLRRSLWRGNRTRNVAPRCRKVTRRPEYWHIIKQLRTSFGGKNR